MKTTKLLAAALLAVTAANTKADFLVNAFGINSPGTTITFDEVVLPNGTALGSSYSSYGLTFSDMYYNTEPVVFGGVSAPVAENFHPIANPFSIFFASDQTDAAFNFITNDGETTLFEAYLDGILQASGTAVTGISSTDFYGFEDELFDEIRITVSYNVNGAAALDNIQFDGTAPVPEVGTMAGAAVFALGALAARRRARK